MLDNNSVTANTQNAAPSPSSFRINDAGKLEQHRIGRDQGEAYERALEYLQNKVADESLEQHSGEYIVTCHIQNAQGLYERVNDELKWREPVDENVHIQISVRDVNDGRFIPNLLVEVTLVDEEGRVLGAHVHPFIWHPWLYYYGRNWIVAGTANYGVQVRIEPPIFFRQDRLNGQRYLKPVEITFKAVRIFPGQQLS